MTMDLSGAGGEAKSEAQAAAEKRMLAYSRLFQTTLDKTVIYPEARWTAFAVVLTIYILRVYLLDGFYIITYALGIYLLNLVIGFLSPAIDPDEEGIDGEGGILPTESSEFRETLSSYSNISLSLSIFLEVVVC